MAAGWEFKSIKFPYRSSNLISVQEHDISKDPAMELSSFCRAFSHASIAEENDTAESSCKLRDVDDDRDEDDLLLDLLEDDSFSFNHRPRCLPSSLLALW
jgi:hypothetical protein